ncbi:23S rRNA (guanosine(2251)-2'-O)-methyltransferase RlmB [Helicobacter sp. 13S00401-1]|uniref:23S rRNA (guanosine(2251)-2'-O)-methyltransferase RlmB n=1 Tax=Helicobacter sp. 13S00401-1 TaxID=1905758 RepID=UPI000BA6E35E|nr:23S rRNA (guanosine(2251)-2'-O)-methyltransferase RlmB [Helicobacter sp. 13S00401-1]PAF49299.1 23S rRNA (guanosine(2251)-2'-O)-methyltransferase RlmB [Helicobacter sp. 13S00401-1]
MLIYGKQSFLYALTHHKEAIEEVLLSKDIDKGLFSKLKALNVPILRLDNKKAQSLAHGNNHQGYFMKIKNLEPLSFKELKTLNSLVVLCGIEDVGNIGAICRNVLALGVEGLLLDRPLSFSAMEGVFRASSGALMDVKFAYSSNILDSINELKALDFTLIGADMKGRESLKSTEKVTKWALFMGSEAEGLKNAIKVKLDRILSIKMANNFNSLNVSVANGILIDRINSFTIKKEGNE